VSAKKPVFLITGADLAAAALALLNDYQIVYAGKAPTDADIVGLDWESTRPAPATT